MAVEGLTPRLTKAWRQALSISKISTMRKMPTRKEKKIGDSGR